ncbi:MAG: hypothetical protein D6756_11855 [Cyanobacteria bacterium J083]|nr:MAG: hypothetical protein D6756_11855 [Cyanobacteria bacterium J083]
MNIAKISPFTSLCLKLIGSILIISSLIDYITLAIPFQILESQWQIRFATQLVDRGIVPMVGMAFLLVGYWIDIALSGNQNTTTVPKASFPNVQVPVFVLSSILGLLFLLVFPLHLKNLSVASSQLIEQIDAGAQQAEQRIQTQYEQLNAIAQNPQRLQDLDNRIKQLDEAIGSGQLQGRQLNPQQLRQLETTREQLKSFRELAQDKEALESRLNELRNQLRDQKLERENRAKTETWKQGIRTGLSSLLLAIGYITIGWLGLKNFGGSTGTRRKKAPTKKKV